MPEGTKIDLAAILGNIKEDQQLYLQRMLDIDTLSKKRAQLLEQHLHHWVAVFKGEVSIAPTQEELIEKLGDNAKHAVYDFLDTKKTLILYRAAA